jgi:mRNA interferase RelE/StbE
LGYNIEWHEKAIEDLMGIDKRMVVRIMERAKSYLSQDPISLGKPLRGMFKGLYRYRFGDYRIIYAVDRVEKTVRILRVGHRKEVYE